jgi:predicted dithiol-disulfide oxidoreductase (DUF899 family)
MRRPSGRLRSEWLTARELLMEKEKKATRALDALAAETVPGVS